jgi:hypothetical protein
MLLRSRKNLWKLPVLYRAIANPIRFQRITCRVHVLSMLGSVGRRAGQLHLQLPYKCQRAEYAHLHMQPRPLLPPATKQHSTTHVDTHNAVGSSLSPPLALSSVSVLPLSSFLSVPSLFASHRTYCMGNLEIQVSQCWFVTFLVFGNFKASREEDRGTHSSIFEIALRSPLYSPAVAPLSRQTPPLKHRSKF